HACAARSVVASEDAAAAATGENISSLRCCPYCNFCCNGMRNTAGAGTGRKKREVTTAEAAAAAAPPTPAAAATTARSIATRKMLAETQRAFVKREKRQNRNRESPKCPLCPCAWCARSSNRDPYASSSFSRGDESVRDPADYSRSGAPSAPYPRGGGATRDIDYPYAPDYQHPSAVTRPRFRSYGNGATPLQDSFNAALRYAGGDPDGFNPRARMPQGGPVRGSGPFARALQMTSPFPWMRSWLSEQIRRRHRILGYE
ncbi:hypothetical protein PMAYCL1PPCAC_03201, partial [Pristionchus mayeri]